MMVSLATVHMVADLKAAVPHRGPIENLPLSLRYKPVVSSLCLT